MKNSIVYIVFILLLPFTAFSENLSREAIDTMKNIKCPICDGQSIYDSNNDISKEMRITVVKMIKSGSNKIDIENYFINKYGDQILVSSRLAKNALVYLLPTILLSFLVITSASKLKLKKITQTL